MLNLKLNKLKAVTQSEEEEEEENQMQENKMRRQGLPDVQNHAGPCCCPPPGLLKAKSYPFNQRGIRPFSQRPIS